MPCAWNSLIVRRHLRWKRLVADGERLVDEHDLGIEVDRHREAEPHVHAGRVVAHRHVDEALELGEGDDVVEPRGDVGARQPCSEALRKTFSRPERSGLKPAPSSSSDVTRPRRRPGRRRARGCRR